MKLKFLRNLPRCKYTTLVRAGVALLLSVLLTMPPGATETSFLQMLFVPADPLSVSLGGANASLAGSGSFLINPAHAARATRPEVSAGTVFWWEDISLRGVSAYLPLNAAFTAGFCSLSSDYGSIDAYSALDTPMGAVTAGDSFFALGAGYRADAFSSGLSFVTLSQRLSAEHEGSAAALHYGAEYSFGLLNTGFSYFLPMGKMELGGGSSPQTIPSIMRAGANLRFLGSILSFAGTFPSEGEAFQSFGIEIPVGEVLRFRSGMNTIDSIMGFSAGVGLKYDRFSFDYGFTSVEIGDAVHSFSLAARLGYSTLKTRLYREARSFFRQGFYEKSQQKLNEVLILDPDYRKAKVLASKIAKILDRLENPSTKEEQ
ncbi:MAG: hypothetical protein CVU78_00100 [Elusimicrobia bacterium HGW-Elusimicrobia-2]|nr:MAG: hypothetical protein CVU78_00100 [Elusimicrobia bacterium HGW-Elusimicrobia-2]